MFERPDRLKAGKEIATGSARTEKVASRPPQTQGGRRTQGDGTRISRSDDVEGTTSQADASHIMDLT